MYTYSMILIGRYCHKPGLGKNKSFEIFREISIFFLWSIRDMQPRLISMHWVENDLEKKKSISHSIWFVKNSLDFSDCILFITCPFSSIWWLVSLSLSKLTTCFIHWAPLAGESGCAWILNKNIQRLAILALVTRRYIGFCCKFIHCISQELK